MTIERKRVKIPTNLLIASPSFGSAVKTIPWDKTDNIPEYCGPVYPNCAVNLTILNDSVDITHTVVEDPRGFKLRVPNSDIIKLLSETDIIKGKISDTCIWVVEPLRTYPVVANGLTHQKIRDMIENINGLRSKLVNFSNIATGMVVKTVPTDACKIESAVSNTKGEIFLGAFRLGYKVEVTSIVTFNYNVVKHLSHTVVDKIFNGIPYTENGDVLSTTVYISRKRKDGDNSEFIEVLDESTDRLTAFKIGDRIKVTKIYSKKFDREYLFKNLDSNSIKRIPSIHKSKKQYLIISHTEQPGKVKDIVQKTYEQQFKTAIELISRHELSYLRTYVQNVTRESHDYVNTHTALEFDVKDVLLLDTIKKAIKSYK